MTGRRVVVLLTLLGALLILLAGTRTWATVTLSGGFPGLSELAVPGRRAAPGAIAIALAAAAGAVVLATSGRIVRFLVAAGLGIAGAVVAVNGVRAARDTENAVAIALRDSLRVSTDRSVSGNGAFVGGNVAVSFSIWPWVAAAGGGLILLAGLLALVGSRSWAGPTRRYERASAPGAPLAGPATTASSATESGPGRPPTVSPAATWDSLSRGEDPTSPQEDPT